MLTNPLTDRVGFVTEKMHYVMNQWTREKKRVILLSFLISQIQNNAVCGDFEVNSETTVDRHVAFIDGIFFVLLWLRCVAAVYVQFLIVHVHADVAIKNMLATLDDPFTRFLEPEKFKSLRVLGCVFLKFLVYIRLLYFSNFVCLRCILMHHVNQKYLKSH